ncbi:reverse transcriptase domain-containing protein [Pseudomonas sp. 22-AL-CL-001]|uniref:reverse transcriptase/maturase family protein n=1 Tax=Pseudomonas alabamensis TaxID=3064349 RepID=UPI002712DA9B|nr:reverse transcriptase/maturase family protein [Pseudomonas sp. 22-AL-CL-001]MDO7911645.1 reverse transcriptase domain-containing protein [Pseudomonas sp. 22-AL-CL-001]
MQYKSLTRIEAIRKANADPTYVNDRLYRLMFKEDLYIVAYEKIKSKPGNMTPGMDKTTLDQFSTTTVRNMIEKMKDESFSLRGARRVLIPKANGKTRALAVAPPTDKVVQEVMRMILEAIFEPTFSNNSHGFRTGRSCHTALRQIRDTWSGVTWVIEGDIKGCFDNIQHERLINTLRTRIKDERFITLIRKALNAGYFDNGVFFSGSLGTPQGSIISPILANVFLHQLDLKAEELIKKHNAGEEDSKARNPAYRKLVAKRQYLQKKADTAQGDERDLLIKQIREIKKATLKLPPTLVSRNGFIRVKYVRYADDWVVGINGPRELAERLRTEIGDHLRNLGLELSMEKTHIRHAKTEPAKFLGTSFRVGSTSPKVMRIKRHGKWFTKRVAGWTPLMYAPVTDIVAKLCSKGFCNPQGEPTTINRWIHLDDYQIVEQVGSVWRGICNYYSFVDSFSNLNRIQYILQHAAAKTLATKHRSTRSKIFTKHGAKLRVRVRNEAGEEVKQVAMPLVKSWVSKPNRFMIGEVDTNFLERNLRLRTRSKLGSPCVICDSNDRVAMHHVKHIRKLGSKLVGFTRVMAILNRKQIPVCHECHHRIHRGEYDGISLSSFAHPNVAAA